MTAALWLRLARLWTLGASPKQAEPPPSGGIFFADPADAPADVVALGEAATQLLDNPVLALAFARVEAGLVGAVKNSAPGAVAEREEAYRLHWAAEALKAELRNMIGAAKLRAHARP